MTLVVTVTVVVCDTNPDVAVMVDVPDAAIGFHEQLRIKHIIEKRSKPAITLSQGMFGAFPLYDFRLEPRIGLKQQPGAVPDPGFEFFPNLPGKAFLPLVLVQIQSQQTPGLNQGLLFRILEFAGFDEQNV